MHDSVHCKHRFDTMATLQPVALKRGRTYWVQLLSSSDFISWWVWGAWTVQLCPGTIGGKPSRLSARRKIVLSTLV